ncbi:MAG: alpha/beta fold hydrolase, partial [Gammaproteobacteria bacterium]
IWLHGLGADAHDFEPIVPLLNLHQPLKFVFPNAPVRPVTINAGMEMRAWYDIDPGAPLAGEADIRESAAAIAALVEAEVQAGTPRNRIVLAGFSQGGVIALQVGLRAESRVAGIMALSTYVHDHEHLAEEVSFASIDTPIFMAHGLADPMIPIARAVTSREALAALNYEVEWHEYGMGHQVCPEEIEHIATWLNRVFG